MGPRATIPASSLSPSHLRTLLRRATSGSLRPDCEGHTLELGQAPRPLRKQEGLAKGPGPHQHGLDLNPWS